MPDIYIIANGFTLRNVSGGDKNFIEVAGGFLKNGYKVNIITTAIGKEMCLANGLTEANFILTDQREKEQTSPFDIVVSYISRGIKTAEIIKNIPDNEAKNSIFICSSDFYCDTLPLMNMADKKKLVIFNMVADNPFLGYSQRLHLPNVSEVHYFLSNFVSFVLIQIFCRKNNTRIIATASNIKKDVLDFPLVGLKNWEKETRVIYYGSEVFEDKQVPKKYDFVWIGRNHAQKGLEDLKQILLKIKKIKDDFTIKIIGNLQNSLDVFVKENQLEKNVLLLGKAFGEQKMLELSSCKVFLFTSHFESFGIVVLENFKAKNLVVGYEIPSSKENFAERIFFVPKFDTEIFAQKAIEALNQFADFEEKRQDNYNFASNFTWEKTYLEYKNLIISDFNL